MSVKEEIEAYQAKKDEIEAMARVRVAEIEAQVAALVVEKASLAEFLGAKVVVKVKKARAQRADKGKPRRKKVVVVDSEPVEISG